jgi:hypothetical protein
MDHNYVRNDDFNILTITHLKGGVIQLTGESKEPIEADDYVNYLIGDKGNILQVTNIIERRDSRDYPKGNKLFYKIHTRPAENPNAPAEEPKGKK